ncbi:efflux RND transporter periplasmic adaptor subunit [Hyphomicrobium nitrativorans]|uniref:efflux RND transporter periplasmic adaptor subunit n=1 Tax=Hyphomicrobium nitrativorans TaxID=1427356 RepID=UPI00130E0E6F|nr:efflux RND transporter periplasmic adaptor subunit [Hyphomicrobium nitrativorans]
MAALAGMMGASAATAADPLSLTFTGVVEPRQRVAIANQVTGVISKVLVVAGQRVDEGHPLFEIDAEPYEIDVKTAKADLDEARGRLRLAEDVSLRQSRLAERGSGAEARATQASIEVDVARAAVARQESALARAELALERTRIAAPIAGVVGRVRVSPGAFVEAEGGTVLGEIVDVDPILVGYAVPYEDRQRALKKTGKAAAVDLFENVSLTLVLPSGENYSHRGRPYFESAEIDRDSGMLTTWAEFPNPDGILVPGLAVKVLSEIHGSPIAAEDQK